MGAKPCSQQPKSGDLKKNKCDTLFIPQYKLKSTVAPDIKHNLLKKYVARETVRATLVDIFCSDTLQLHFSLPVLS